MACERCKDPNKTDTDEYTVTKAVFGGTEDKRKQVLCAECAEIVRSMHKLTGGKAPEAKPSEPGPEAREESSELDETSVINDKPARRRRY